MTAPLDVLDRLPPEEKEVLILASFYGLAKDEIASIMGASRDIVEALMRRAKWHLAILLAASGRSTQAA